MAKTVAIATPDPSSPAFNSPAEAADAVSRAFGGDSEQAAVTFQRPDGKHVYSTVSAHSHENFELHARMPKDWKLSGTVHSHPGQDDAAQWFSPQDLDTANQVNAPAFIRFMKDNSLRSYTPGKTQTQLYVAPGSGHALSGMKVSRGDPVAVAPSSQEQQRAPTPPPAPAPALPTTGGLLSQAAQASL